MRTISIASLLLISGCSWFGGKDMPAPYVIPEPVVVTKIETVPIRIYQPPLPREIDMLDVNFWVITEENYQEKRAEIEKMLDGQFVVFALTPDGYEKMSENLQELRRYFKETKEIILYYKKATTYEIETEDQSQNGQTPGNDGKQSTPGE